MDYREYIESLRGRVPWPVMSQLLKFHNFDAGRGWEKTIPKLDTFAAISLENKTKLTEILVNIYNDHLLAGEKTVRFYQLPEEVMNAVINLISSFESEETPFDTTFPLPLTTEELKTVNDDLHLCRVDSTEHSGICSLIYCSKRFISEKIDIDINDYLNDLPQELDLGSFSELTGTKKHTKQFFDVIIFDPVSNLLEIRFDTGNGLTSDQQNKAFFQLERKVNELITLATENQYNLPNAINIFPAIDKLYRSNEGRVCELAFTTEGGSIKHEKMRRRHQCLREEVYHQAGTEAVDGQIATYKIATTWELIKSQTSKSQPELMLPGNSRMLQQSNTKLTEAVITKCSNTDDYDFVKRKLSQLILAT